MKPSLNIWCWFSLHWGELWHFSEQNFPKQWVLEVRSYPSPKGLGEFSYQQHMRNEKRKSKKILENHKCSPSKLNTLFASRRSSLVSGFKHPPHVPMAYLVRGFCLNSWARPDKHLSFHHVCFWPGWKLSLSFPKHPSVVWNLCHSH